MIQLWLAFVACALVAAALMLWPLWRFREARFFDSDKSASLVQVFRENLTDLEAQQSRGGLSADTFNALKTELERNLLRDYRSLSVRESKRAQANLWRFALAFSFIALVCAFVVYEKFGSLPDVRIQQLQQQKMQLDYQDMLQNKSPDKTRAMALASEYEARLQDKPNHLQYLFLLARLRMDLGQYPEAIDAYQKILAIDSQSSLILAELAQAMFMRDGNNLSPKAQEYTERALLLDAKNSTALGLMGLNAYNHKDFKSAVSYWRKTIAAVEKESPSAKFWQAAIEKAKQEFRDAGGKAEDLEARSPFSLQLQVSLAPSVKLPSDAVVFIYARVWEGSPMPLAVARVKVADLPQEVYLDETMAMSPVASLATAEQVEVVARISQDGSAQAKAGDWQASQGPVDMKAIPNPIRLEISQQIK